MKQELEHFLVRRFPDIFVNVSKSPEHSAMCFGFECDDGWFHLLYQTCSLIQNHINRIKSTNDLMVELNNKIKNGDDVAVHWLEKYKKDGLPIVDVPSFVAMQVKEKFGTLRFYYNGGDSYIDGVVSLAEQMSGCLCEECGNSGKTYGGGWIKTLCDLHAGDRKKHSNQPLSVGDKIDALSDGDMKTYVLKEVLPSGFLAKEFTETYDKKAPKTIVTESVELYAIKHHVTNLFSYYEALQQDDC